ncbi:Gfo/Idh/MocA family protein [Epibacterium sp. Ofav1-8]|uniref:Gfo/Idh/MocA family protein n=1 Tax=Epibacterium sp. Ofav1-8 TaxID=2917735 RepID=UPI0021052627|nr:Gfo/Idh/MocA family oxidoreductase [Epibacterium sp. Ofav1-8]
MTTFRWGILSTGNIANAMASALQHLPDAKLLAVASRQQETAAAFAARWEVPRAYSSHAALLADPDVDIVYIGTPNAAHKQNILEALAAGKHVLCEKPLTTSAADTAICIKAARAAGLFLMEAMWTAFFPALQRARSLIAEGAIGTPRHLTAQFVSQRDPERSPNLFDPALGGGATLDLGIYPVTVAQLLAGPVAHSSAEVVTGKTGVDEMVVVAMRHNTDVVSQLSFGFHAEMPVSVHVTGDSGSLTIPEEFHHPSRLLLLRSGETEEFHLPYIGNGYAHEAKHLQECVAAGLTESDVYPLALSATSAALLERWVRGQ